VGRLIRKQAPWPAPSLTETRVRTEHFYYDGIRRIQETFTDPIVDDDSGSGGVDILDESEAPQPQTLTWTEREYIWGPDQVDELVAQIVPTNSGTGETIQYAMLDPLGCVQGLVSPAGVVQAQYSYDPYGELLAADVAAGTPRNRVGHQGLFFDRLDAATTQGQLGRGFVGLYYNRNRTYSPELGRFLQRDPNGTGMDAKASLPFMGSAPPKTGLGVDVMQWSQDGLNPFSYVRNSPLRSQDPTGLFGFSMGELMFGMTASEDLNSYYNDSAIDAGMSFSDLIMGQFDVASMEQMADISWASNWDEPDEEYSRSGFHLIGDDEFGSADASDSLLLAGKSGFGPGSPARLASAGIYALMEAGEIIYVGRSMDLGRREREWARKGFSEFVPLYQDLTYDEMRGLEQHSISKARRQATSSGKRINNKIRGVSKSNKNRPAFTIAARNLLRKRRR